MSINNSGLDFTFNPQFNPRTVTVPVPAPVVQAPVRSYQQLNTNPLSNVLLKPSPEAQSRVNAYSNAAAQAYVSADEIGRKITSIKLFIQDVLNPNIRNEIFAPALRQHLNDMGIYRKVCEEVAQAMTGNRNVEAGEHLLNENFRIILRIKDYDGRNLLDQIVGFYTQQLDHHRGIGELNAIGETLESYSENLNIVGRNALGSNNLLQTSAKLKSDAIQSFQSLPDRFKGAVCKRIYELDGGGAKDLDYGYTTALADIQKILFHKGAHPIKDAIASCSQDKPTTPVFINSYVHVENINSNDSKEVIKEVQKLYELEDLKYALNDPYKNNDFLLNKYRNLTPETKLLLDKTIRLACYQPLELGFSENLVSRNVRLLLDVKNQQGVDIVSQLIDHQREKIKGHRLIAEMQSFISSSMNQPPSHLLTLFNNLSEKAKHDLRERVWKRDGGEQKPELCGWQEFFGGWGYYGTRKIEAEPNTLFLGVPQPVLTYLTELQNKIGSADNILLQTLEATNAIPNQPIDVSSSRLERDPGLINNIPHNLRVAYVTAELRGVASIGGLASAVEGMVRGFGADQARVIMPLYRGGVIGDNVVNQLQLKKKYEIEVDGKKHSVCKATISGIKCYFIEDNELFWIPPKEDGTAGNFYEGDHITVKHRWVVFQSAAAELAYKFSKKAKPVDLVHVHDSQTALVPKFLAARHPEEWRRGETPATVFTFHNNLEPMVYRKGSGAEILQRHGLSDGEINSFVEAHRDAEITTTVSDTYGKEVQTSLFGNGLEHVTVRTALQDRLVSIVNGNSNDWNPTKDEQLQNWTSVQGTTKGTTIDLRFGPDTPDLADKIKTCQREVCAYLKSLSFEDPAYADLDPEKPTVFYVGRYDWSQKGVDKLRMIMEETVNNGGQFVCVGVEPSDKRAADMLREMKEFAKARGKKGVLVLEDRKENGRLKYQQGIVDKKGKVVQYGFGSLFRAAFTTPIFPSIYEPCGLVQGELNRFGKKVVATKTGGFIDTLKTEGPEANGYLFNRKPNWFSFEQDRELLGTLKTALSDATAMQQALYHGDANAQQPHIDSMRTIMRNAINSTWETTPDGSLSAIRRLELAMAKAFVKRKTRGQIYAPLNTFKV